MSALLVSIRAGHFAAVILLLGTLLVATWVAAPAFSEKKEPQSRERGDLRRVLLHACGWTLLAAVATGTLWFVAQAAAMSGVGHLSAVDRELAATVLGDTLFGRVTAVRAGLALALTAALCTMWVLSHDQRRRSVEAGATLLAGALLGTLAWTGHAAAEHGIDQVVHLAADVVHLLAAGAWLGGLPALVLVLRPALDAPSAQRLRLAAATIGRFSTLGLISVSLLVVTGTVNAWYTVGRIPELLGTGYGTLLLAKIGLFGLMLVLAGVNRVYLTPRIVARETGTHEDPDPSALRWLRRTAAAEFLIGVAIVIVVGVLGTTIPARHEQPVWPVPYTLDWNLNDVSKATLVRLQFAAAGVLVSAVLAIWGVRARRTALGLAGAAGAAACIALGGVPLLVPAYPTTYVRSPVPYTAASVMRGRSLFVGNCEVCHGPRAHGDGPAAGSLSIKPADLVEHAFHHPEGDLFWWVEHGMAGTPMPSFAGRLSEHQVWDVINFLRALAQSDAAEELTAEIDPWRPISPPDFTFQTARHGQESLKQLRGRAAVLLVFYSSATSMQRIRMLSAARLAIERAGVRIVAIQSNDPSSTTAYKGAPSFDASILAVSDQDAVAAYALFAETVLAEPEVSRDEVEFLIDKQGYLRARWKPGQRAGWSEISELERRFEALSREKPHARESEHHVH
jgi:putative copper export protein/mono/diheme cytochrome c family protein/peroxiredoxin